MSQERITVCTVGRVDGIRKLAALGLQALELERQLERAQTTRCAAS